VNSERSLGAVFSDLLSEFTALFRNELRLARAELSEKAAMLKSALVLVLAGAFVLQIGRASCRERV